MTHKIFKHLGVVYTVADTTDPVITRDKIVTSRPSVATVKAVTATKDAPAILGVKGDDEIETSIQNPETLTYRVFGKVLSF